MPTQLFERTALSVCYMKSLRLENMPPHLPFPGLPKWRQNRVENNIWLWWQNFFHVVAKTRACVWVASTPCKWVCVCSHVGVCCYLCGRTTLQLVGGAGNTRRPGSKIAGSTKSWRALYVHKNIPAAHSECVSTCLCVCVATAIKRDI